MSRSRSSAVSATTSKSSKKPSRKTSAQSPLEPFKPYNCLTIRLLAKSLPPSESESSDLLFDLD